jgi:hypothetical protein
VTQFWQGESKEQYISVYIRHYVILIVKTRARTIPRLLPLLPPRCTHTRPVHFLTVNLPSYRVVTNPMSPSPPQEASAEGKAQDELEENGQVVVGEAEDGEHPVLYFTSVSHPVTR